MKHRSIMVRMLLWMIPVSACVCLALGWTLTKINQNQLVGQLRSDLVEHLPSYYRNIVLGQQRWYRCLDEHDGVEQLVLAVDTDPHIRYRARIYCDPTVREHVDDKGGNFNYDNVWAQLEGDSRCSDFEQIESDLERMEIAAEDENSRSLSFMTEEVQDTDGGILLAHPAHICVDGTTTRLMIAADYKLKYGESNSSFERSLWAIVFCVFVVFITTFVGALRWALRPIGKFAEDVTKKSAKDLEAHDYPREIRNLCFAVIKKELGGAGEVLELPVAGEETG